MAKYRAYNTIKFCKNTNEDDLYNLFGDSIGVMDENSKEIPDYFKNKRNLRNGWDN